MRHDTDQYDPYVLLCFWIFFLAGSRLWWNRRGETQNIEGQVCKEVRAFNILDEAIFTENFAKVCIDSGIPIFQTCIGNENNFENWVVQEIGSSYRVVRKIEIPLYHSCNG